MLGDDFEQLWLDVFELRSHLDIAARHAVDDQGLTSEDEAAIEHAAELATRAKALANTQLTDAERAALSELARAISSCEGRGASYRLAASRP